MEQSVPSRDRIDANTVIVLKVVKIEEEPTIPPVIPTVPPDSHLNQTITISLPEDTQTDFVVSVRQGDVTVEQRTVIAGTVRVQFELWGEGFQTFEIWIDNEKLQNVSVNFGFKPIEPTEPEEPADPLDPTGPSEPVEPSDPTLPTTPEGDMGLV